MFLKSPPTIHDSDELASPTRESSAAEARLGCSACTAASLEHASPAASLEKTVPGDAGCPHRNLLLPETSQKLAAECFPCLPRDAKLDPIHLFDDPTNAAGDLIVSYQRLILACLQIGIRDPAEQGFMLHLNKEWPGLLQSLYKFFIETMVFEVQCTPWQAEYLDRISDGKSRLTNLQDSIEAAYFTAYDLGLKGLATALQEKFETVDMAHESLQLTIDQFLGLSEVEAMDLDVPQIHDETNDTSNPCYPGGIHKEGCNSQYSSRDNNMRPEQSIRHQRNLGSHCNGKDNLPSNLEPKYDGNNQGQGNYKQSCHSIGDNYDQGVVDKPVTHDKGPSIGSNEQRYCNQQNQCDNNQDFDDLIT
ncbi:hypothetical protein HJFPF1_09408 [Paramyrothecium foliicola]|nr:hypothetical protein HJFPF1_09408 [Paramyrothecium foliicola]